MIHPLLNPDSKHYDSQDRPAIFELEEILSVAAMAGWCEGNIFKYEHRKKHKGQEASDEKKIKTYKDYLDELKKLLHSGHAKLTVSHAYQIEGITYEY